MKKLKYFDGCELEYMITLGLWNKTSRRYTSEYWSINKAWNKLRDDKKLFFLPKMISKILIAKYMQKAFKKGRWSAQKRTSSVLKGTA